VEVGIVYSGVLTELLLAQPDIVDVLSVIPEMFWHETSGTPRYRPIESAAAALAEVVAAKPVVLHGIGLSIGSGLPLDLEHLEQVASMADSLDARWFSEHLAAFRVSSPQGRPAHVGVGLPVPYDCATLRDITPKVSVIVRRLGIPVLIENNALYVEVPFAEMTEAAFLNRLVEETGSGVLLDLHNLVVCEQNLGWRGEDFLDELDLDHVVEIHVAGGEMMGDWYTDAHSGACPPRVWELLSLVVPKALALRLVTFELHESRCQTLGYSGLQAELQRIRRILDTAVDRVA
jgi:uncharacterized protein (UPF0276 family)